MSDPESSVWLWAAGSGFAVLLLLDLVLSTALVAVAALHRVALHRMSESEPALRFAEALASPASSYHVVTSICRQLSLLGAALLAATASAIAGWSRPAWVGIGVGALISVVLIETLVADLVALRYPRGALRIARPAIRVLHAVLSPVLFPLIVLAARVRRDVPNGEPEGTEDSEDEAEAFIEVAEKDGILEASEGRMMRGIVDLGDTKVREIMTPRTDIIALPAEVHVREALRVLRRANHTRLPVYRESVDNVVGILHVRDLVQAWEEGREADPITAYMRPAFFVPEVLPVGDLLGEMRTRTHIALAVDEYGGIAGLVTLEDVLEEIVGDIRDEHDLDEALVMKQADGSWLVSGSAHVERLEQLLDLELAEERDFDTVGGLVVSEVGRVPEEGASLEVRGLRFEIVKADSRRVYRVRVRRLAELQDGPAGGSGA